MSWPTAEREALTAAARNLDLDSSNARLVSASSRLIWHLPKPAVALTISRPSTKSRRDVDAETTAMRVAAAVGVRTPRLRGGPIAIQGNRWAFASDWVTGRHPGPDDWPAVVAAAATLADAATHGLPSLSWPDCLDDQRIGDILGHATQAELLDRSEAAARDFHELMRTEEPVLAHTDLQPANVLCDDAGAWLLDLEYAALAPREWDPAKLVILARRFGDPSNVDNLLESWPRLNRHRLHLCVETQEVLLVGWLARMAGRGIPGAAREARHRGDSLSSPDVRWRHLS